MFTQRYCSPTQDLSTVSHRFCPPMRFWFSTSGAIEQIDVNIGVSIQSGHGFGLSDETLEVLDQLCTQFNSLRLLVFEAENWKLPQFHQYAQTLNEHLTRVVGAGKLKLSTYDVPDDAGYSYPDEPRLDTSAVSLPNAEGQPSTVARNSSTSS